MRTKTQDPVSLSRYELNSSFLRRTVIVDIYQYKEISAGDAPGLLLINDGQDLPKFHFQNMLGDLIGTGQVSPLCCAGIHCGADRKMEYGIAGHPDFKGRGAYAGAYTDFVFEELLPFIETRNLPEKFTEKAFAGFSLGGLSVLDIVWNHPAQFSKAGVFSGSFWWRSLDQTDPLYDDNKHRIMHQLIRNDAYKPGLQFFFQCGNKDETRDRNQNGVIDSIDDTLDLMEVLKQKGYSPGHDMYYLEIPHGRHDVATWGKAMPAFLKWGWGK